MTTSYDYKNLHLFWNMFCPIGIYCWMSFAILESLLIAKLLGPQQRIWHPPLTTLTTTAEQSQRGNTEHNSTSTNLLIPFRGQGCIPILHTFPEVCTCTLPIMDWKAWDWGRQRLEGVSIIVKSMTGIVQKVENLDTADWLIWNWPEDCGVYLCPQFFIGCLHLNLQHLRQRLFQTVLQYWHTAAQLPGLFCSLLSLLFHFSLFPSITPALFILLPAWEEAGFLVVTGLARGAGEGLCLCADRGQVVDTRRFEPVYLLQQVSLTEGLHPTQQGLTTQVLIITVDTYTIKINQTERYCYKCTSHTVRQSE